MERCDVAIIGAGPYGLSAATYLQQLKGLDVRLLGEPMSFWERHMPGGMQLRSPWSGSHIADPGNRLTLDVYRGLNGIGQLRSPIPLKDFVKYGHWIHQHIPCGDTRKITELDLCPRGYELTFEDGETLQARRVVVAAGIQPFAHRPELFRELPESLVTHTSEQRNFDKFREKEVVVIGGGQSAMEAAVFLKEAGARGEVFARSRALEWIPRIGWTRRKTVRWMFYGRGEIGSAGVSLIIQRPNAFRRLPRHLQDRWAPWAVRPAVAVWLRRRAADIPIHFGRTPVGARVEGERLRVRFDDGSQRLVDHVVLGTGYRIDVRRYPFFSAGLLERLDIVDGYPRLGEGFETSLPGLHIIGAPAAWSFGPLMKFVAGTEFASPALQSRVLRDGRRHAVSVNWHSHIPDFRNARPVQARNEERQCVGD
jgi:cation diffusion facilitator CzcD-associated flavoprotein CzcO